MSAHATNTGGNRFLGDSYTVKTPEDMARVYNNWASTYDDDMRSPDQDYVGPMLVAEGLVKYTDTTNGLRVLDAGCGTGLVGSAVASKVPANIDLDGVDLTPGMLKLAAQKGVYRDLKEADLNKPLSSLGINDSTYDAVVSSGTLTHGHVGPAVLSEFVRVIKPNGVIVTTVLDDIWESVGYRAEVDNLKQRGEVQVVSDNIEQYCRGRNVVARLLVLKKVAARNAHLNGH